MINTMADFPYMEAFLCFTFAVYLFHSYLDIRQLKALRIPHPPAELAKEFSDESFKKSQAYSIDKWWFNLWHGLFSQAETILMFMYGFLPWMWNYNAQLLAPLGTYNTEVVQTMVFLVTVSVLSTVIEMPWSLYSTFVIEERHGFNKQTLQLFVSDIVKQVLLTVVLGCPITAGLTVILQMSGPRLPMYLWLFMLLIQVVMLTIYPVLIAPLFNKFESLEEGQLKSDIEALAGALGFPLKKLYKMDGSKRSHHSNAYMYGFFKNKRIVLFDTLIEQCSVGQVVAVLAHELGHWKLRHTPMMFVMQQATMLLYFSLFSFVRHSDALYSSFGFVDAKPAFVSLMLFLFIIGPLAELISFVNNLVSRTFEFQADAFAVQQGKSDDLTTALVRLQQENKSALNVDKWYSTYHYSHPPLVERLKAINQAMKKQL